MPRSLALALALALPLAAVADTLTLRDGRVLQGVYRGGTAEMLHFEIDGTLRGVPLGDVVSVSFLGRQPGDPAPTAQQAAPAPSVARVAAGTRLRVRLAEPLDPHKNVVGDGFAGMLEMELQAAGTTIVASGSKVVGRISQIEAGAMTLELTSLQIGEASQPIVTGTQQMVAAAGNGPAAPAPASDRIPAGSLFEFRLLQPFDVRLR
ncbi:MAG TPA: hypothetical protein VMW19_09415 [Myxococcota bacterium]|nr:hypothetical protein [Myxococcota bacterium]